MKMNDLYRGFVKTKGKEPVSKFKNIPDQDLLSEDAAAVLPEYAGVLARDIVLIDVDNPEMSDVMFQIIQDQKIRCRVYKTTRGKHFLFWNRDEEGRYFIERQSTKGNLACGLAADVKAGCNNGIEVLKYDGKDREVLLDPSGLDPLPFIFWPVEGANCDLWKMKEGDGRNDALFRYMINCMRSGMNEDQVRFLYHEVINKYIFTDQMNEKELNGILRAEAFEKILVKKGKPDYETIADLMIAKDHVVRCNGVLYIYQKENGSYCSDHQIIKKRMHHYVRNLTITQKNNIFDLLQIFSPEKECADSRYILFQNGIYDSTADKLISPSPEYLIQNQIPWNYNPDADGEQMEAAIWKWCCDQDDIFDLIEEMIGYCMCRTLKFRKFFIFVGGKRNAKSTFLNVLTELIGPKNISNIALEQIGTRFINAKLMNKLVNIGDDIENAKITYTATLRKFVSGEGITVENKGQDPIDIRSYATLIFSANEIPVIIDPTGSTRDRMIIIPFNAHFEEGSTETDPNILETLMKPDNMEYLIRRGIKGLQRLLKNKQFTKPKVVEAAMNRYRLESDPIAAFLEEYGYQIEDHTTEDVLIKYIRFCEENDIRPAGKDALSKRIHQMMNLEAVPRKINGKSIRIYKRTTP